MTPTLAKRSDMVTGSSDDGKNEGHSRPSGSSSPGGGGKTTSSQTSPATAASVVVAIFIVASIAIWLLVSRIRRSRRNGPLPNLYNLSELSNDKPALYDVEVGAPVLSKHAINIRWPGFLPVAVNFASDKDRELWRATDKSSHDAATPSVRSSLPADFPLSTFNIFSRTPSPSSTLVPDDVQVSVSTFIVMPSSGGSQSRGELCLGVARSTVM
ncbi:hypothetical protein FKP32DRAFT_888261 [Trametes sanguinea]|nr:hypothetical protein FKP32DRAFT_888261 [Trametes sanguinea]